ncbi:MAG: hypothetical protein DMF63_09735 [Acidobacteria bacterium]|nr:MAG: hypothetical protein DMF63_09735 [Acidobacteriota bacterium]
MSACAIGLVGTPTPDRTSFESRSDRMHLAVALQATENQIVSASRKRRLNSAVATRRNLLRNAVA